MENYSIITSMMHCYKNIDCSHFKWNAIKNWQHFDLI